MSRPIRTHETPWAPEPSVVCYGELGAGGAPHHYGIYPQYAAKIPDAMKDPKVPQIPISFQEGTVNRVGINGCTIESLLAICHDRLLHFQAGWVSCPENVEALIGIDKALSALKRRTADRALRKVESVQLP